MAPQPEKEGNVNLFAVPLVSNELQHFARARNDDCITLTSTACTTVLPSVGRLLPYSALTLLVERQEKASDL